MAEQRTIKTVLELSIDRFTRPAAQAAASAKALSTELAKIGEEGGLSRGSYDRVSNSLLGIGAAAAAGLGAATKAAMDWESAWAGVRKTVDGTDAELAKLEEGLRGLARELPASHTEIAAVAEAAGQLGVARTDIVDFTRTMINLGETTNLTADEAATAIAQLTNVMGTASSDVDNFASSLVALGNDGASTEADILSMAQRLSGTGALIGASEQEILGLSSALSSVGVSAEAGGGSLSRVLQRINTDVLAGGDDLRAWADVAGVSAETFSAAWRESPVEALGLFNAGLMQVKEEGGNAVQTLSDLGIKSTEETRAILSLAGAGDLLADSLDTSNTAWDENLALTQEAAERYKTTEAQVELARNALVDAGIDIGATVLPALAGLAGGVADVAQWFSDLPGPLQSTITGLGGIVAVTGLAAGGMLRLVPAAMDTVGAFQDLRRDAPRTASALGKVGAAAGRAAGIFAGLQIAGMVADGFREIETSSDGIAAGLLNAAAQGDLTKETLDGLFAATGTGNAEVRDLQQALDILDSGAAVQTLDFLASGLGVFDTQTEVATRRMQELDDAFSALYTSGNGDVVAEMLANSGVSVEDLLEQLPTLSTELTKTATEMGLEADAATLAAIATGELVPEVENATTATDEYGNEVAETTSKLQESIEALDAHADALAGSASAFLDARSAARDYADALEEAYGLLEEEDFSAKWGDGTEGAREMEEAIDGVASAWIREFEAATENGQVTSGMMQERRDEIIALGEAYNVPQEELEKYLEAIGLAPSDIEQRVDLDTDHATAAFDELVRLMNGEEAEVTVEADTEPAEHDIANFSASGTAVIDVSAQTTFAEEQVQDFYRRVNEEDGATVQINGETMMADEALATLIQAVNDSDGTVLINGNPVSAETSLLQLIDIINAGKGEVTVTADTSSAEEDANHTARDRTSTVTATAQTGTAEYALDQLARTRRAMIVADLVGSAAGIIGSLGGRADGGWINPGLNAGGWVPGAYPGKGIDNVLWPVLSGAAGGRSLAMQPLAGTEFVVNGQSAKQWGPALEAINAGLSPSQVQSTAGLMLTQNITGLSAYDVARESNAQMRHVLDSAAVPLTGG